MTTCLYDAGAFPMPSPLRCCRGDSDSFVAMQGQSVHLGLHIPILLNHICSCWLTLHQKTPWNERPKQHPIHSSFPQQVHKKNAKESFNGGAHHFCTTAWARLSIDISYLIGLKVHRSSNSDHPPKLRWFCQGEPSVSQNPFVSFRVPTSFSNGELSTVLLACWFYSSYPPHHTKFLLVLLLHLDLRCINRPSWMAYHSMLSDAILYQS